MSRYIIPVFILAVIIAAYCKKVPIFDNFIAGAKESLSLVLSIFPFVCAIMIAVELFSQSGLADYLGKLLSPVFKLIGIPPELCELMFIRPLSGNGSIAMLSKIYATYGVDSYISNCASVMVGSSETVFYVATVYFSATSVKKLRYAIPVSLLATLAGAILSCVICRLL